MLARHGSILYSIILLLQHKGFLPTAVITETKNRVLTPAMFQCALPLLSKCVCLGCFGDRRISGPGKSVVRGAGLQSVLIY